ncbi:MAG: response regulator [candidate division NC10 bacterium]|nr:response regulator [candidate division NC10 bacterium]
MESLMTVREASRYLKVNLMTVYKLAQRGMIPASKVGGNWRIKKELLDEWLIKQASGKRLILVVDDDDTICDIMKDVISKRGHRVIAVNNGESAIKEVKRHRFDLIFLDIIMPGTTGLETFKVIKQLNPKALVVVVTGFPDHRLVSEAIAQGPFMVMRKPFGLQEIHDVLDMLFKP